MPSQVTVFKWLAQDEDFAKRYAHAREMQADKMADDILAIADDGINDTYIDEHGNKKTDQDVIGRSRLRVDARKWLASKMAPKKYGDRQVVDVGNADNKPFEVSDSAAALRLAAIFAAGQQRKDDDLV